MTDCKHRLLPSHRANKFISILHIFGTLLVVFGHTNFSESEFGDVVGIWFAQFRMPLFMFISGYLMKYSMKTDYADLNLSAFTLGKMKRLLLPYFVISLIALGPKILLNSFAIRPVDVSWLGIIKSFAFPLDNTIIYFWFLPTLFIIFVITSLSLKYFKSHIPIAIMIAVSFCCQLFGLKFTEFLNINGVVLFSFWWGLGFFYTIYEDKIKEILKLKNHFVALAYFICTLTPIFLELPKYFTFIFTSLGILMCLHFGYWYVDNNRKFLDFYNGCSYPIYLFSWFPQIAVRIICVNILDLPSVLVFILSMGLGIFIPVLIAKFIKAKIPNKLIRYICGVSLRKV